MKARESYDTIPFEEENVLFMKRDLSLFQLEIHHVVFPRE